MRSGLPRSPPGGRGSAADPDPVTHRVGPDTEIEERWPTIAAGPGHGASNSAIWVDLTRWPGSALGMRCFHFGGWDDDAQPVHGTFATAAAELPRIAGMGFDVVNLPVHPIGRCIAKGHPPPLPTDVGSPWAIGSDEGRSQWSSAWAPSTLCDDFVSAARDLGMESRWTWRNARRIIRGPANTGSGSPSCRTAPARSTEVPDIYPLNFDPAIEACTTKCCAWCNIGLTTASSSFASTIPPSHNFWAG